MKKTISLFYRKSDQYRLVPVHGAWGNVSPQGDIVADLYVERVAPPDEVVLEVEPGKAREVEAKGQRNVREVHTGLVLKPEIAHALGVWLMQKAAQAGFVPPEGRESH